MGLRRRFLLSSSNSNTNSNANYFSIIALEDGLQVTFSSSGLKYKINNQSWETLNQNTYTVSVNAGDKLSFKGNLTPSSSSGIGTFKTNRRCVLSGNILSLLFRDNFEGKTDLTGYDYAFSRLFYGNSYIIHASDLLLPATTLASECYSYMFYNCTGLTTAPELPATTLASYCYNYMFGCTSLTTAPELPATTLATSCYYGMFYACTSLTVAPALPATTLTEECYYSMFSGCKSLTTAPALLSTTLANNCYSEMFYGCSDLTTAPELPATTLASSCYSSMFRECTSLTTAPALPATILVSSCYSSMFSSCKSLTEGPELPATTLESNCYNCMFYGCTSLTTAPELPATTLAPYCYNCMFYGCTSLTVAPELPATTLADWCYGRMLYNCSSLTEAPILLSTTLVDCCYNRMFYGCSKLNNITMLATDISADSCLYEWVYGVASSGTFTKHPNMTSLPSGVSGIPTGWAVEDDITITSCKSLVITANDVPYNLTSTTIYWTAICEGELNGEIVEVTKTGVATSESFEQNSTDSAIERTISFTYMGVTATTTIIQQEYVAFYCNIVLNNQWQLSNTISNPDSTQYEGVYESFSNKGINNSASVMYVDIFGLTDFTLYIRSYAESSYDYVMVSQIDQTINSGTSYSNTTLIKSHTCGNQNSNTTINGYTKVDFTNLDGGEHRITILYRKDSSSHQGDDRGYILIPKSYNPFVIN